MLPTSRFSAGFEWQLAWRMVRSKKSRFLSAITVVAVVGIACGVMALTIVLSVTGGFQSAFRDRILGLHPHLLVWPRTDRFTDYRETIALLEQDPRIIAATPATYDEMMIAHGDRRAGAVIKGVDPHSIGKVLDLKGLLTTGDMSGLDETPSVGSDGDDVVLGNLVQETSWTVLRWGPGSGEVTVIPEDVSLPLADEVHVSVVNAATTLGPIDVALAGSDVAETAHLAPGQVSRPVSLPAGDLSFDIKGTKLFDEALALDSARSYIVVVLPGPTGMLIQVDAQRPAHGEARLRYVDARVRPSKSTLRVGEVQIPPGETRTVAARPPSILLGSALAKRLAAKVGDRVAMASHFRGLGARGPAPVGMEPTSGRFQVAGIFQSGYYEYDKRFAVVAFRAALRFLNVGDRAKWLEVRVDDVLAVDDRKRDVEEILQPYSLGTFSHDVAQSQGRVDRILSGDITQLPVEEADSLLGLLRNSSQVIFGLRSNLPSTFKRASDFTVLSWKEVNEPLFQALKLQKLVLTIFFLIIIVVAAFNIVGTQIMMVNQKTREIAILKALGSSRWIVRKIFLIQGLMVAALGTAIGLVLGLGMCLALDRIGYPLEPEVYFISKLPVAIDLAEIGIVAIMALILTFLATLYSAGRAGRLMPAEGIRYVE